MSAAAGGGGAAGILFLIVILIAMSRGCDSPRRRYAPDSRRIHELSRSVESLQARNAELTAMSRQALKEAESARRDARSVSATATTGALSQGLIGGALLIVSGALGTALLALRRRRRAGSHG